MFSRMLPSWSEINKQKDKLTQWERCLLEFLDNNLPKDENFNQDLWLENYNWRLIFSQPYLNWSRPDIVVFNPMVWLQIIEVKDRELSHYTNDNWSLRVNDWKWNWKIKKTPIQQVNTYKEKIIWQLLPFIWESNDYKKQSFWIVKVGVFFYKATSEQANNLFSEWNNVNWYKTPVFWYDFLQKEKIWQIIPDIKRTQSKFRQKDWSKEVLWRLIPPYHYKEQLNQILLTKHQKDIVKKELSWRWHHRIRWVAWSGKTEILAYKAGELASKWKSILVLTFNITLWHLIRDRIQRAPFDFSRESFSFNHFHGFCKDILNDFWEKRQSSTETSEEFKENFFRVEIPNLLVNTIKDKEYKKYDAILIDEWQDYCMERYKMLSDYFLEESNEEFLMIICDKKQNIYNRETIWLDKRKIWTEKFWNWLDLKSVIRLTEKVAKITQSFSELFNIKDDLKIESIERPSLFNDFEEHIVWENINYKNRLFCIIWAFYLIKDKAKSNHPSDTIILVPSQKEGLMLVKYFQTKNIEINHIFWENNSHKKSFWMWDSRLKICTIYSFKWRECRNVIVYIKEWQDSIEVSDRLFYTAITRTKENLVIINSNKRYNDFIDENINKDAGFLLENFLSEKLKNEITNFEKNLNK